VAASSDTHRAPAQPAAATPAAVKVSAAAVTPTLDPVDLLTGPLAETDPSAEVAADTAVVDATQTLAA